MTSLLVQLLVASVIIVTSCRAHWTQHYRYGGRRDTSAPTRHRRQFGGGVPPQQIDLNITVPFIFSARLYPYGERRGDRIMDARVASQAVVLRAPLAMLGEKHTTVFILRDGAIGFQPGVETARRSTQLKHMPRVIAPFWAPASLGDHGRVYFRETQDANVLNLAKSEVQIQYRYGDDFAPTSVLIVTWEHMAPAQAPDNAPISERNVVQAAIVLSPNGTFAHFVYSKLRWNDAALAGFNADPGASAPHFALPGSGTADAINLANISDIGIPGEWLFKLDGEQIHLCGPGYDGLECIDECRAGRWSYDCGRRCNCAGSRACNTVTGACPNGGRCRDGWTNAPTCDVDIDECDEMNATTSTLSCPPAQPHCINTLGAFVCTCATGYDKETNICIGSAGLTGDSRPEFVEVVPIQPQIVTPRFGVPLRTTTPLPPRPTPPRTNAPTFNSRAPTTAFAQPPPISVRAPMPVIVPPPPFDPNQSRAIVPTIVSSTVGAGNAQCTATCGGNAQCVVRADGRAECVCDAGFSGDGQFCVDINECFMENECGARSTCNNVIGAYDCVCDAGFVGDGARGCVDVDECLSYTCAGGNRSTCVNAVGTFACRCARGYNGHPESAIGCIDVNECLLSTQFCGAHARCANTDGAYECTCDDGYTRALDDAGCVDIDECLTAVCDASAVCTNTPGGYSCGCASGSVGDGRTCKQSLLYPFDRAVDQQMAKERDSAAELPLRRPVRVFGRVYDKVFISINGIVSFDNPLLQYTNLPLNQLALTALAPLYVPTDLSRTGGVYVRQPIDSQGATADYATLTRASLDVERHFKKAAFLAESVLVVTYDQVATANTPQPSTAQLVLTWSGNETYAIYVYDTVADRSARAGVLTGAAATTMALPGSAFDSSVYVGGSNVDKRGTWMFRIDDLTLMACSAGRTGAPDCRESCAPGFWGVGCRRPCRCAQGVPCDFVSGFCTNRACQAGFEGGDCQFDIDECASERHECAASAVCTNVVGSYECACAVGYAGNGRVCERQNACLARFGQPCARDANCVIDVIGQPQCTCADGTRGDGFVCTAIVEQRPIQPVTTRTPLAMTTSRPLTTTTTATTNAPPTASTLPRKPPTTTKQNIITRGSQWPSNVISIRTEAPATPPPGDHAFNTNNNVLGASAGSGGARDRSDSMSNLLVIIIPSVLCGIWLILIVVLLVVCMKRRLVVDAMFADALAMCRRQKQSRRAKHGLNYYMAPNAQQPGNIPAVATAKYNNAVVASHLSPQETQGTSAYSTPQPAASSSAASPSAGAGAWSMPRPNNTYDYYQSTAYYPYGNGNNYKYN